jgi:hypothetical protein
LVWANIHRICVAINLTSIEFIFILLFLSVLLISSSLFHNAFAESPAFDQIFVTDEQLDGHDWVQTYGNDSTHLRSDYANILAVDYVSDYVSDGKTLNTTLWLKSNSENASTYSQPFKKIRYGMFIAIASLPPTSGYNGANYDFYIEAVNGKWSEYLYLLSSTGTRALIYSKVNYTESFGPREILTPFWATYGEGLGLIAAGVIGVFSTFFVDYIKDRKEHK